MVALLFIAALAILVFLCFIGPDVIDSRDRR